MQANPATLRVLATAALLALGATFPLHAQEQKPDPTATWAWTTPGRDGGEPRKTTLKLKVEGEKLVGTMAAPGRQGGEPRETPISKGMIKGDEISFEVTRTGNNNSLIQKYTGKLSGNTIKGKIETERNGNSRPARDWEAKREPKS